MHWGDDEKVPSGRRGRGGAAGAQDGYTGLSPKGQQTHFHLVPPRWGGDGCAPGLPHTSGTGLPEREASTLLLPVHETRNANC